MCSLQKQNVRPHTNHVLISCNILICWDKVSLASFSFLNVSSLGRILMSCVAHILLLLDRLLYDSQACDMNVDPVGWAL